jgi:hypothetical protein
MGLRSGPRWWIPPVLLLAIARFNSKIVTIAFSVPVVLQPINRDRMVALGILDAR